MQVTELQELKAEVNYGFQQSKRETDKLRREMRDGFQISKRENDELREEMREGFRELRNMIELGFAQTNEKFAQVDARFDEVDKQFAQVDLQFEQIGEQFKLVDKQFKEVNYLLAVNAEGMSTLLGQPPVVKKLRVDVDELQADNHMIKETVALHSKQLKA